MKIQTSKERRTQKQTLVAEPYQHPSAIVSHVYMITSGSYKGAKYHAIMDNETGAVRLYGLDSGVVWSSKSAFGSHAEWEDITDKVYLNTDDLE